MSDPKDPKRRDAAKSVPPDGAEGENRSSGRAGFDERGNSVWEWQLETGVYSRDITTQKLKKLDLNDLSIAETATFPRPRGLGGGREQPRQPGGGFNPYDNSRPRGDGGGDPYDTARNTGRKLQPTPAAPAQRKPLDAEKLEEWLKIKKRAQEADDKD